MRVSNAEQGTSSTVESEIYAPACIGNVACNEASGQRTSICGSIPSAAQVSKVDLLLAAASDPRNFKPVEANQDVGGAKFSAAPAEYAQSENRKAVCVELLHWSDQAHIARIVLHYDVPVPSEMRSEPAATVPTTVATTQALIPTAHAAE